MSDSDERELDENNETESVIEMVILNLLETKYICILEKDKTPAAVLRRKEANEKLLTDYNDFYGNTTPMTEKQMNKKINNMKSRVKDLTDRKKTGNKTVKLREWEAKLYELLGGIENPTLEKIPAPMALGAQPSENNTARPPLASIGMQQRPPPPPQKRVPTNPWPKKRPSSSPSPDRGTTVPELQIKVLSQQIKTLKVQEECAIAQIKAAKAQEKAAEAQMKYFEGIVVNHDEEIVN